MAQLLVEAQLAKPVRVSLAVLGRVILCMCVHAVGVARLRGATRMNDLSHYFHAQACNNAWANLREFLLAEEAPLRAAELAALGVCEADIWRAKT